MKSSSVPLPAAVRDAAVSAGKGFARAFLDAYGWPPMTDPAIEKLRHKYAR